MTDVDEHFKKAVESVLRIAADNTATPEFKIQAANSVTFASINKNLARIAEALEALHPENTRSR